MFDSDILQPYLLKYLPYALHLYPSAMSQKERSLACDWIIANINRIWQIWSYMILYHLVCNSYTMTFHDTVSVILSSVIPCLNFSRAMILATRSVFSLPILDNAINESYPNDLQYLSLIARRKDLVFDQVFGIFSKLIRMLFCFVRLYKYTARLICNQ